MADAKPRVEMKPTKQTTMQTYLCLLALLLKVFDEKKAVAIWPCNWMMKLNGKLEMMSMMMMRTQMMVMAIHKLNKTMKQTMSGIDHFEKQMRMTMTCCFWMRPSTLPQQPLRPQQLQ